MELKTPAHQDFYKKAVLLFLAYLAFVVYGSLVPLELRPHSLSQAVEKFTHIPWLNLGPEKRADWVANAVLYLPLAFLACTLVAGPRRSPHTRLVAVALATLLCGALAVAVEFTQIFFAPRTVSLNDLVAEGIGIALGAGIWLLWRPQLTQLWRDFNTGGRRSLPAAIVAFLAAYLGLTLFPFDFVLSGAELSARLQAGNWGLLLAHREGPLLRTAVHLLGEIAAILPLGILLAMLVRRISGRRALVTGMLLGLLLELLQLLLVSAVSQGASVFTRGIGLAAGVWLGQRLLAHGPLPLARWIQRLSWPAWPVYLAALLGIAGWYHSETRSLAEGLDRLGQVRWMPFYFHYYTTETVAMASLLANFMMYAPLGVLAWARQLCSSAPRQHGLHEPLVMALALVSVIEFSKLWLTARHPDPTNLLIGAAGALLAYSGARWFQHLISQIKNPEKHPGGLHPGHATEAGPSHRQGPGAAPRQPRHGWLRPDTGLRIQAQGFKRSLAALLMLPMLALLWRFPVAQLPLAIALLMYFAALSYNPRIWLIVIPAVIPALDLTPLSGWFFWESSDFFLLATLMAWLWYGWTPGHVLHRPRGTQVLLAVLLGASFGSSTLVGLWPMAPIDANAFNSYFSDYYALRAGKGFFWILLLLPLMYATLGERRAFSHYLVPGIALGFGAVALVLIWERQAFPGLFNFHDDFRVTATFSSMHVGGGHVEAYLALVLPILVSGLFAYRLSATNLLFGAALLGIGSYALLVTYSRAGIVAVGISFVLLATGLLISFKRHGGSRQTAYTASLALLFAVALAAALPVLQGSYLQDRLARTQGDFEVRKNHWKDTLAMMSDDMKTRLFGMGLGQFPKAYLYQHYQDRPLGNFAFAHEKHNTYLQLVGGEALYYEQIIDIAPDLAYTLEIDLRTNQAGARLDVPVCAKSLLYSYECQWLSISGIKSDGDWHSYKLAFNSGGLGEGGLVSRKTSRLSLYNPSRKVIEVDKVRLIDPAGADLVRNGDFSALQDHWLFSTDNYWPWHIAQLWLQVYFEQGLVGLLVFMLFLGLALTRMLRVIRKGNVLISGMASGLTAFLGIGLLASPFDAPRLTMMFFLIGFAGLYGTQVLAARATALNARPFVPAGSPAANPPPPAPPRAARPAPTRLPR